MRSIAIICLSALTLLASPAAAQERTPAERQGLIDLAYILGESHALRQACEGPEDQFWRLRMLRMVQAEQPDAALDKRVKEAFNTGFVAGQTSFPSCTPLSRREESRIAARGRALVATLNHAVASNPLGR
jgi:uncharacterized protein (TIGR02301 family)